MANFTLIAPPLVEKVTVSFDTSGGTGDMAAVTLDKGFEYTLPECGFTPPSEKFSFECWEIDWERYGIGDTYTVTADTTIKAAWRELGDVSGDGNVNVIDARWLLQVSSRNRTLYIF